MVPGVSARAQDACVVRHAKNRETTCNNLRCTESAASEACGKGRITQRRKADGTPLGYGHITRRIDRKVLMDGGEHLPVAVLHPEGPRYRPVERSVTEGFCDRCDGAPRTGGIMAATWDPFPGTQSPTETGNPAPWPA